MMSNFSLWETIGCDKLLTRLTSAGGQRPQPLITLSYANGPCFQPRLSPTKASGVLHTGTKIMGTTKYYQQSCDSRLVVLQGDFPSCSEEQASHLCNNPQTVQILFHLVYLESGEVNRSRICCRLFAHTRTGISVLMYPPVSRWST